MYMVDVVVDLQRGDGGKGKVAKVMADQFGYTSVCKFNGGGNAGHTVFVDKDKYVTHYLNSGIFRPECNVVIGPGCVLHIQKFLNECNEFDKLFDIKNRVYVSENAHVITDDMLEQEKCSELANKIGTTGQGIGPAYTLKANRSGKRIGDYLRLNSNSVFKLCKMPDANILGDYVLMEGSQGVWLDPDHGTWPYVTSSNCMPSHAFTTFGIPMRYCRYIVGVAKFYETYSGSCETLLHQEDDEASAIRYVGDEYGATTGRPRKVGYLDIRALCRAINMTGVTHLVFSKIDVLDKTKIFKIWDSENKCVYSYDNRDLMIVALRAYMRNYVDVEIIRDLRVIYSREADGSDIDFYPDV